MVVDVVIAGAGPNGLMLACELALGGVRAVVLEPRSGPLAEPRANGLVGQVVQVLYRRGLYQRLAGGNQAPIPQQYFMWAAFPIPFGDLPGNPVYTLMAPQAKIEKMLADRAVELGATIHRGHSVTGFTQDNERVLVDAEGTDGAYRIEARYLVGADGGKSLVRKQAGIDFPGRTNDRTVSRSADVTVPAQFRDPSGGLSIPGYGVIPPFMHHRTERGLIAFAPFPGGRTLLSVSTPLLPAPAEPAAPPLEFAELREAFTFVVGFDLPVEPPAGPGPHMARRQTGGNTRLADRYREGRVLLLGDAAHVHSAIGGPGLNLGLQDALNLGWKLAATVRGTAPDGLLDTYESERRPVAERVVLQTTAQAALIAPGPEVTALRTLFAELLHQPATVRTIAGLIAGSEPPAMTGTSPLVGRLTPDLGDATHGGRFVLVDNTGTLSDTIGPWRDRVDLISAPLEGATALLVRPDCQIAWADDSAAPDPAGLRSSLGRWIG